jgi:hypothetical protein
MKTPGDAPEKFANYLAYWMNERGLDSQAVAAKAKRRYGALSNATMTNLMSAKPADMMVRTVEALAYAIQRPPEEVFMAKLGHVRVPPGRDADLQGSYFANLERQLAELPEGESKRVIVRFLQMVEREMERVSADQK